MNPETKSLLNLPSSWDEVPLKRLVDPYRPITYGIVQAGPDISDGVPYIRPVDMDKENGVNIDELQRTKLEIAEKYSRSKLERGDLVVSIGPSSGKVMIVSQNLEGANLTQGTARVAPGEEIDKKYLFWYLRSKPARSYWVQESKGATFMAITLSILGETPTPKPPLRLQRRIARFLDTRISYIDRLIEKKQKLLNILDEKRQAVIDDIVYQNSTSEYAKLKYVCEFLSGYAFSSNEFSSDPDDIRLLRGINVDVRQVRWEDTEYWPKDQTTDYSQYLLEPGDIVLGMDRPWIKDGIRIAQIEESDCPALLVQRVLRIRTKPGVNREYIRIALESDRFRQYFEPLTTGVSVPHISQNQVENFEVPVPPESEQKSIVSEWNDFAQKEKRLKKATNKSLQLLQEKRQSLITAAVTGQIEINDNRLIEQKAKL